MHPEAACVPRNGSPDSHRSELRNASFGGGRTDSRERGAGPRPPAGRSSPARYSLRRRGIDVMPDACLSRRTSSGAVENEGFARHAAPGHRAALCRGRTDTVPTSTSKSGSPESARTRRHATAGGLSAGRIMLENFLVNSWAGGGGTLLARSWLGRPGQDHSDLDFRTAWPAARVSFGRLRTSVLSRNWSTEPTGSRSRSFGSVMRAVRALEKRSARRTWKGREW
ncbi:hypothetical protein BX281_0914 [Streptomyces sp. Ag82_O1-15]|nr:hypothetical protein BX281_0914 [Streptomyces sp. Ag82_O1-15]